MFTFEYHKELIGIGISIRFELLDKDRLSHMTTNPHLREVFTLPGLIHMESMESLLAEASIYCSMDIMDSMWNDHRMVMEWLIPYGIWAYPLWIPWNKSIWILLKFHMENTMIFVAKNSVKYEN